MIDVTFKYMAKQPFKPVDRKSKQMRTAWSEAFRLLDRELRMIQATDVVIEAGYQPRQLRADGWPKAESAGEHGQVRIGFKKDGVPISFFFGGWTRTEYNVYMIARTLEALRAVERYGCAQSGEQYRGWSALPPGASSIQLNAFATVEEAGRFLLINAGRLNTEPRGILESPEILADVYRAAVKRTHPDAGGNKETFAKVNAAKEMIEAEQARRAGA